MCASRPCLSHSCPFWPRPPRTPAFCNLSDSRRCMSVRLRRSRHYGNKLIATVVLLWFLRHSKNADTYPFGRLSWTSLTGPSWKLAILYQLVCLFPFSSFGPWLTASAYLTMSLPTDVACTSGVAARRPIICILARGRAALEEKERTERGI